MHTITPHRFDEDSVRAYREHEGEVSDEVDAARDCESEDGREDAEFGPFSCRLMYVCALIFAGIGVAAFWWPQ